VVCYGRHSNRAVVPLVFICAFQKFGFGQEAEVSLRDLSVVGFLIFKVPCSNVVTLKLE
jgi:hypothetical protein